MKDVTEVEDQAMHSIGKHLAIARACCRSRQMMMTNDAYACDHMSHVT